MKRLWDAGALLNKWYFLFIILLHSAVCAIIVQNALAFFLNLGLAYLVRGFLSLHFIVNGVESYKPTRKIGPFYILGDDHYIFYGYPFRRRISPVTGYLVNFGIAILLYLFSMSQLLLRKYENIWLDCATGVLLGTVLGFLKISMQANHAYQENMKTAKQMFMEHYGNLKELSKIEKYRQLNPSTYYETKWMKEMLHTDREEGREG